MIVSKVTLAVRFLLKHWDREKRPYTPDLNGCNNSWFALLHLGSLGCKVGDVN